ncbi:MAG: T9SS type A sorting domain-containing protein, partial [Bacteroidetes bacterium]
IPVSDELNIRALQMVESCTVFDATGRMILSIAPASRAFAVATASWPNGVYVVELSIGGNRFRKRVVKR